MSKLKTIVHIGKIICEIGVIAFGIVALCTPAAGIAIATAVIGAVAWGLSQAENVIQDHAFKIYCDQTSLNIGGKSKMVLISEDDTDLLPGHIDDDVYHTKVNLDDALILGNIPTS